MMIEPKAAEDTTFFKFVKFLSDLIEKPVIWFREVVVLPNRQEYAWYHEQIPRVPTVDECYNDDHVCIFEADQQYKRDRMIDNYIMRILRRRFENCVVYNSPDDDVCKPLKEQWHNASLNYFIKYGDMGKLSSAKMAYMKQKHRMIWERRHGPIGSGKRNEDQQAHE